MDANTLENTLKKQQWVGGQAPTAADAEAFEAVKSSDIKPETHPNLFAWFCLVSKFSDAIKNSWGSAAPAKGGKGKGKAAKKEEDDDLDLFGDEDEGDAEAAKKAAAAAKEKAQGGAKKKKVVTAMSLVMLEVKPLDDTTNLDDLAQ